MPEPTPNPPAQNTVKIRGWRQSATNVLAVLELYDNGHGITDISRKIGLDRRTIGGIIRLHRDRTTSAKALLSAHAVHAAQSWLDALPVAAEKGRHEPARDLLLYTGAIQPISAQPVQVGVQVVLGNPAAPVGHDPLGPATLSASLEPPSQAISAQVTTTQQLSAESDTSKLP
jgi:hypothetical protein